MSRHPTLYSLRISTDIILEPIFPREAKQRLSVAVEDRRLYRFNLSYQLKN